MPNEFGWEFWADSSITHEDEDGGVFYEKDGYCCYCPPGVTPGDAESLVRAINN